MAAHRPQRLSWVVAVLSITVGLAACVSTPESVGGGSMAVAGTDAGRIDDLILVDCLLPGQIRQLGSKMTYMAPRRRVKATKSDCGIRGGEFVLFDRSDYGTALQTLLPQAQSGDAVAQTYVAEIYEKGLGLSGPDYAAAARWYRRAAESGHRPAQTNLGLLYERGLGVAKDKSEALNWYRQAAGVTEDRLIFESKLKAERAAFRREIALRNRVASSLGQQLKRATATSGPAAPPTPGSRKNDVERVAKSLSREAASEKEQVQRQLRAVQEVKKGEDTSKDSSKKAQMRKLELSLRQELDALDDNQRRLASARAP
ncbi:MAG: sel1 repeat family protein [Chromatiaceae bacterium]|jgi:hypothetical protein|nr:sel1 repeat family protein [Chromatiaceae bacterium]